MKPLPCLLALAFPVLLASCGVANGIIQPTRGLIDSAMRTVSDAGHSSPSGPDQELDSIAVALKVPAPAD